MSKENMRKYDDMLDMPHHVSKVHPQMPVYDRAAQFASFAALKGHGDAVCETARLTDYRALLDEEKLKELDRKIAYLQQIKDEAPEVRITYFVPDLLKEGGSYHVASGTIKKINSFEKCIIMSDNLAIPTASITEIESDTFF